MTGRPRTVLPRRRDKLLIPPGGPDEPARLVTLVRLIHEAAGGELDHELWLAEAEDGASGRLIVPVIRY